MPRGIVEKDLLRHIHQYASSLNEDDIRNAYQKMRYKRKARIKNGNLVLEARLKKYMSKINGQYVDLSTTEQKNDLVLSQKQFDDLRTALENLDCHTLLVLLMGNFNLHEMLKQVLNHKISMMEGQEHDAENSPYDDISKSDDIMRQSDFVNID